MSHLIKSEPTIYAIVNIDNGFTKEPTTCIETAMKWIGKGYTVSVFTAISTAETVEELDLEKDTNNYSLPFFCDVEPQLDVISIRGDNQ